jgi:hypothetical protein
VNNLNDGMSWAIFPIFFAAHGLGIEHIGVLKAVYPAIWGVLQTVTGSLSDRWGPKGLIVWGMWVQAAGLILTAVAKHFSWWLAGTALLGNRHSDGPSDVARGHFGRRASNLAGTFSQHLSFLARFGLRRGRAACWRDRGCFRVGVGNRGDWTSHLSLRTRNHDFHARNDYNEDNRMSATLRQSHLGQYMMMQTPARLTIAPTTLDRSGTFSSLQHPLQRNRCRASLGPGANGFKPSI